jgi:hypothetical protein
MQTKQKGDLEGYGTVWYNPNGIANILSLSNVQKENQVTYNSDKDGKFIVHTNDGTQPVFEQTEDGLFYLDTNKKCNGTVMLVTVESNKDGFTQRQFDNAKQARKIQNIIGRPSTKDFINIVNNNLLKNCPISDMDICNAEKIFGPNLVSLKGKTVHRASNEVPGYNTGIPKNIMKYDIICTVLPIGICTWYCKVH